MNYLYSFIIAGVLFSSCTSTEKEEIETPQEEKEMSLEELAKRHVESDLQIPSTEKYSMRIYKENLDGDAKEDAIITVNRLENAFKTAEKSGKSAKLAEIGFMGNHNYFFYFDGALGKITPNIPVMSSPYTELKINFINLMSDAYKDVTMDFRILNASYKDFITIKNHNPKVIFEWNEFENLGKNNASAVYFDIVERNVGLSKDIVLYKANLENNVIGMNDVYHFTPIIKKTNEKLYSWFYNPDQGKYCTTDKKK